MSVFDLDDIVETYARKCYGKAKGLLPDGTIEIDYSKVRFSTEEQGTTHEEEDKDSSSVLLECTYENKTDEVQDHTFLLERQVEATAKTSVTKGFSRGGKVGIKVAIPAQIANATASFGTEIEVATEEENVVKHAVKWGMQTRVKAEANHRTKAKLTISETESKCDFWATIKIRGKVVVRLIDSTGNAASLPIDISKIIKTRFSEPSQGEPGVSCDGIVSWKIKGSLCFKFGVSQNVTVESKKL